MKTNVPVRVAIIEDQSDFRTDIEMYLQHEPGFVLVGSCGSVEEAFHLIPATRPDLLLLDVQLSDGLCFPILEHFASGLKVIFLTAYQEHAIRAIKYGALDFLLKPFDSHELRIALQKVLSTVPVSTDQLTIYKEQWENQSGRIVLADRQFLTLVEIRDIVYCQSREGYTTFFLVNGKKIVTAKYLKEYEDMLPADQFIKTHQSYLVNIAYIHKYDRTAGILILVNKEQVPVSVRKREAVVSALKK